MAVTSTTMTELDGLAKDFYNDILVPQGSKKVPLKAQLDMLENYEIVGRPGKAIFGLKLQNGGGAANAGARKSLPQAGQGTYDQGEVGVVRTYTRLGLDNLAIELSKSKKGSYKPAVEEVMEDRDTAMNKEVNRQMFCNADGKVALTPSGATSTTQTLGSRYGVTNGGNPAADIFEGDQLMFYDNLGAQIALRTVTGKAATLGAATCTVTVASITSVTNGWVSKATADTDNSIAGEAKGLLSAFVQTGTFQAVPIGATYQANVLSNSGNARPITDPLVMTAVNIAYTQTDEYPDLIVTRPGISQLYSEVFLPLRQINGQEVQLKAGYKPAAVFQHAGGSAPILTDNGCPGSRVFVLNTKYIRQADLIGQKMFDGDGAAFTRITDQDGVEGFMRKYWALAWTRLNCHVLIEDVQDIASVAYNFS